MQKTLFVLFFFLSFAEMGYSQLMVSKQLGKSGENSKLGYGTFASFDYPLPRLPNQSIRLEILDFAYFPRKDEDIQSLLGYLSIKLGYKYVFSEDQAGWYLIPSAGWVRVVSADDPTNNPSVKSYKDGIALALEGGYSIPVGRGDGTINLGLKYEDDLAGTFYNTDFTLRSLSFRASYAFHIFGGRGRD